MLLGGEIEIGPSLKEGELESVILKERKKNWYTNLDRYACVLVIANMCTYQFYQLTDQHCSLLSLQISRDARVAGKLLYNVSKCLPSGLFTSPLSCFLYPLGAHRYLLLLFYFFSKFVKNKVIILLVAVLLSRVAILSCPISDQVLGHVTLYKI
jgi:hypothetical protein